MTKVQAVKVKKEDKRKRGWCFTVPLTPLQKDPVTGLLTLIDIDALIARVMSLYEDDLDCKYMIVGDEISHRTKLPHLQGYIYYTNKKDFKYMQELMYPYHIEPQKSKLNCNAYVYCMKDWKFIEYGERPQQGNRTDLNAIQHLLETGHTMEYIKKHFWNQWVQYRRSFDQYVIDRGLTPKFITNVMTYTLADLQYIYEHYKGIRHKVYIGRYVELDELVHEYHKGTYENIFIDSRSINLDTYMEYIHISIFIRPDADQI